MNKKAGEFGAGLWFILTVIYFIFFIFTVNASENIASLSNDNVSLEIDLGGAEFTAFYGNSYCANPRYKYNAETGEKSAYSNANRDHLYCEETEGVLSQSICEDINGCSWENITTGFWFWESVGGASCIGNINTTPYGIEFITPLIGRPKIKEHNYTSLWERYTPFADASPCEHPNVIQNKSLCDLFSCEWTPLTVDNDFNTVSSIYSTVADVFTFRYTFGFSNKGIRLLMNFLFIVLPLLILIMSLYFMIPILH